MTDIRSRSPRQRGLLLFAPLALLWIAACGGSSSPVSPSSTSSSTSTTTTTAGTGVTTYTYTTDIRPILTSDCTRCHNSSQHEAGYDFTTYAGVMRAAAPGNANSLLIRVTSSRGIMYPELTGNRVQKAQTIYDWVVTSAAAQ